jgi:hypothetical protein
MHKNRSQGLRPSGGGDTPHDLGGGHSTSQPASENLLKIDLAGRSELAHTAEPLRKEGVQKPAKPLRWNRRFRVVFSWPNRLQNF